MKTGPFFKPMAVQVFLAATRNLLANRRKNHNFSDRNLGIDDSIGSRIQTFGRAAQGAGRRAGFEKIGRTPGLYSRISLVFPDHLAIETDPFAPKLASTPIALLRALQKSPVGSRGTDCTSPLVLGIVE